MALIIRLDWLSLRCCIAAGTVGSRMGISLDKLGEASHCPTGLATRAGSKQPRFGITKPGHDPLLPIELGVDAGRIER